MKGLYFQHSDGSIEYIKKLFDNENYLNAVLDDLKKRNPKFKSYYQRVWTNDKGWTYIDVGSHTEFYVLKDD